jgi:uncharacterized protein (TIGR03382 family)
MMLPLALFLAASPTYPNEVQQHLNLGYLPQCIICHETNAGGFGTATKPFAVSMKAHSLTGGSNIPGLDSALDAEAADKTDSDHGGVDDITELKNGTDPNNPADDKGGAEGEGEGGVNPGGNTDIPKQVEYGFGCAASSAGGIAPLIVALVVVKRRRR